MPEMTDTEKRTIELFNDLWNSPDPVIRAHTRETAKKKFPDSAFAREASAADMNLDPLREEIRRQNEVIEQLRKDNEERAKKESDAEAFRAISSSVDAAANEYNLTAEGRDKMLARMKETGNLGDPSAAAAWVVSKQPKPEPATPTWATQYANPLGFDNKSEELAALHKNPERYLEDQLVAFTRDPEGYTQQTFAQ